MEFQINEFLSVHLEGRECFLYVGGKRFIQCIRLILNIAKKEFSDFAGVNSIDEAFDKYKTLPSLWLREEFSFPIKPEQEFWGHCSNLQVWAENNYDTRIIASNLGFPLLRKLSEVGDHAAKKVYKDEVAKRFCSGHVSVIGFLVIEYYLDVFSREELDTLFETFDYDVLLSDRSKLATYSTIPMIFSVLMERYDKNARKIYMDWILKIIGEKNFDIIYSLIINNYLKILNKKELDLVVSLLELDSLDQSRRSRLILTTLMKLGSSVAKERFLQMITDLINNDEDFQAVSYSVICGGYDESGFTREDFQEVFKEFDYEYFIEKYSYMMPLFLYKLTNYGIEAAQRHYINKEFLLRYLILEEVEFFLELALNIEEPIKICLEEFPVPPNVPFPPAVVIKNKRIIQIHIKNCDSEKIPKSAENLPFLQEISLK